MKNRFFTLGIAAVTILLPFLSANAALDKKYYKKVAEKVWTQYDPIFNAKTVIPDSLTQNSSAVILAQADAITTDHVVQNTIYSSTGQTNRLKKTHTRRSMVKLLDQSAVDYFTDFDFGHKTAIKYHGSIIYSLESAFGARIYKPDGTVTEVDLSDAIETGDGKKGKDDKYYKIAIPGLEPGDVLEYFTYDEEIADGYDLDPENVVLASNYPILNRRIDIATDPAITVEYKCYNGVPNLRRDNDKGKQTGTLTLNNIPGINFNKYTMKYRQVPFIRFQYLNNNNRRYIASNARSGGLYGNIHAGKIFSEFGDYLKDVKYDSPLNNRAIKMVNDRFLAEHPNATPREIADAAYLAMYYQDNTAKNDKDRTSSQFERALIFNDILVKMNVYPVDSISIGLINPRSDVPVDEVSAWHEASFIVRTPDAPYYMRRHTGIAPGEMPGTFKGEKALLFSGDRKKLGKGTLAREYFVPGSKVTENTSLTYDTVTIADDRLFMRSSANFRGADKVQLADFTDIAEWNAEAEDFFNIPSDKRYKDKSYDAIGRANDMRKEWKELAETLYGTLPDSVTSFTVVSHGIRPDAPEMNLAYEMEFTGLVEELGDVVNLSLGKITGMPHALKDNERTRLLDVMLPYVSQETHSYLIKAPEGYSFDEKSVEELARNHTELVGQFFVSARINDDGDLEMSTVMRYKFADVPLQFWPNFLALIDKASEFGEASVILVRK